VAACGVSGALNSGLDTSAALLRLELIVAVEEKKSGVEREAVGAGVLEISCSRLAPEVEGAVVVDSRPDVVVPLRPPTRTIHWGGGDWAESFSPGQRAKSKPTLSIQFGLAWLGLASA